MRNKLIGMATVAAAGFSLSACGGSSSYGSSSPTPTTAPPSTAAASAALQLENTSLGAVVADSSGHTLYAFTNDKNGVSSCYDVCATTWPPALASNVSLSGTGIAGAIGTTDRKDGSKQLTLNNWPLYRFAADGDTAGAVKGQGNKGVWFVVNSGGALVGDTASTTAAPAAAPVKKTTTSTTPTTSAPSSGGSYDYNY